MNCYFNIYFIFCKYNSYVVCKSFNPLKHHLQTWILVLFLYFLITAAMMMYPCYKEIENNFLLHNNDCCYWFNKLILLRTMSFCKVKRAFWNKFWVLFFCFHACNTNFFFTINYLEMMHDLINYLLHYYIMHILKVCIFFRYI